MQSLGPQIKGEYMLSLRRMFVSYKTELWQTSVGQPLNAT